MPVPGKEDRDAVGWSSKRVAENGPPVVRAFASTREGREERKQQARERQDQRLFRPLSSTSERRGGDPPPTGPRDRRPRWATDAAASSHETGLPGDRFAGSKQSGNDPMNGVAGPSNWRAYSPSQPADPYGSSHPTPYSRSTHSTAFMPPPPSAVANFSAYGPSHRRQSPPLYQPAPPSRPAIGLQPSVEATHFIPRADAAQTVVCLPSSTTATPPAAATPKLVFRPTRRPVALTETRVQTAPAHEEQDELKEGDPREEDVRKGGAGGEDKKPTKEELEYIPVDPDTQRSGAWALWKQDIPAACFGSPGKNRILARQEYSQLQFGHLLLQGKTPTHSRWRDDGFVIDWERREPARTTNPVATITSPTLAAPLPSLPQTTRETNPIPATAATPRAGPSPPATAVDVRDSSMVYSWDVPRKVLVPKVPGAGVASRNFAKWARPFWLKHHTQRIGGMLVKLEEIPIPPHGKSGTKRYGLRLTALLPGEEWRLPSWVLDKSEPYSGGFGSCSEESQGGEGSEEWSINVGGMGGAGSGGAKERKPKAGAVPEATLGKRRHASVDGEGGERGSGGSEASDAMRKKPRKEKHEKPWKEKIGREASAIVGSTQPSGNAPGPVASQAPRHTAIESSSKPPSVRPPTSAQTSSANPASKLLPPSNNVPSPPVATTHPTDPSSYPSPTATLSLPLPLSTQQQRPARAHVAPAIAQPDPTTHSAQTQAPAVQSHPPFLPPPDIISPLASPSQTPSASSPTLALLETELFANLERIDVWTQMIFDYPDRKNSLRKQVERVQDDIFRLQAEISRRKRGG